MYTWETRKTSGNRERERGEEKEKERESQIRQRNELWRIIYTNPSVVISAQIRCQRVAGGDVQM